MILTKLQGGLGNQLFQWAVSKNLSLIHETDYSFETSYFRLNAWGYELDKFKNIEKKFGNYQPPLKVITDDFHYKTIPNDSFLNGYWQSEKYFKENEETIRDGVKIPKELSDYIFNKYPILNENTLSIHVRRGDYVALKHVHPLQTIEYYNNAYDIINDSTINVMVFSDDIKWCEENIKFNNVNYVTNENNITDMYTMSLCKHNIIANSSFSWWGSWLNSNVNKKVVAPINWFNKACSNSDVDIVPENWIKI